MIKDLAGDLFPSPVSARRGGLLSRLKAALLYFAPRPSAQSVRLLSKRSNIAKGSSDGQGRQVILH